MEVPLSSPRATSSNPLPATMDSLAESLEAMDMVSCGGQVRGVPAADLALFFRNKKRNVTSCIDLPGTPGELSTLLSVCEPVNSVRGSQDLTNSKTSSKLDVGDFSINLSPEKLGIAKNISDMMLEGEQDGRYLRVELCGLNVCTEGACLKAYKGKRGGKDKVGLLVMVLPTAHEGGALIIKTAGDTTIQNLSSNGSDKTVHWSAFFLDTEHEVEKITNGYRLTLTYNLFLVTPVPGNPLHEDQSQRHPFHQVMSHCLRSSQFLPEGGIIGFGLQHEYLILTSILNPCSPSELVPYLKGIDYILYVIGTSLGLEPNLEMTWDLDFEGFSPSLTLLTRTLHPHFYFERMNDLAHMLNMVQQTDYCEVIDMSASVSGSPHLRDIDVKEVNWIIPRNETNEAVAGYILSDKGHKINYSYGNMVLIMRVPRWSESKGRREFEYEIDGEMFL